MTKLQRKNQSAYGDWLKGYDWTYWATLTTKYSLTLPSARRIADGFYKHIAKAGFSTMFWAAEPFDTREGYHLHALIRVSDLLPYSFIVNTYQTVTGNKDLSRKNWNRIQLMRYNPKLGAGHYCAKYITKELADYDFYGK
jgi:hypothetical protein